MTDTELAALAHRLAKAMNDSDERGTADEWDTWLAVAREAAKWAGEQLLSIEDDACCSEISATLVRRKAAELKGEKP